jgi:DNA-binding beta-propeller fold protein YncE
VLAATAKELEGEPFVVVHVHSPKFPNEMDAGNVRDAVRRYGVTEPVLVDSQHAVWQQYGVSAWPTLVLVDAAGYIVGAGSGEPDQATLADAVRKVLAGDEAKGILDRRRIPTKPEPPPAGALSYPGKVVVGDGLLVVADTGHDQIVLAQPDGTEIERIGSGERGLANGSFAEARLRHPNGLALAGRTLYIADTGNHAIRAADLDARTIATVAGTGRMSRGAAPGAAELRSPWDLAWLGTRLFVAMAGAHQIWAWDAKAGARPFAGTGREIRRDGPASAASFAQPSGLALDDNVLYVADSEISSIRAIEQLDELPQVRTICGSGELFGFGDRAGIGSEALLQHPMGIAAAAGVVYVADTFNHKIKAVNPATGECTTLFGNGEPERLPEVIPGYALSRADSVTPAFFEPEGVAVRERDLIVADTNNHRILSVNLDDGSRRVLIGS